MSATTTLLARDVMQKHVITVTAETPVQDVARILCEHQISGAPVQERDGTLIGLVSLSDIGMAFFGHLEPMRLTARDVMTPVLLRVTPYTPIHEVATLMGDAHVHRLLVFEGKTLVGIISTMNLVGLLEHTPDD